MQKVVNRLFIHEHQKDGGNPALILSLMEVMTKDHGGDIVTEPGTHAHACQSCSEEMYGGIFWYEPYCEVEADERYCIRKETITIGHRLSPSIARGSGTAHTVVVCRQVSITVRCMRHRSTDMAECRLVAQRQSPVDAAAVRRWQSSINFLNRNGSNTFPRIRLHGR